MASKLKVDELEGVTTAGSIDVTSEGGAVSTNLQQGLAKMWENIDASSGTPVSQDGLNNSTLADRGTGQFTASFTNPMNNDNYSIPSTGSRSDTVGAVAMSITPRSLTTSDFDFNCEYNNGSLWDYENIFLSVFGDLA